MSGRLIVFEGTDGSGKSTQFARLCERLEQGGTAFRRLIFPQYQEPSSALLRMYLNGEFGTHPDDVNPYAASTFYAVDRYAAWKKDWGSYYREGGLVLSDRYTTSNAVHQTCKLPEAEWESFIRWLFDFECGKLGLPLPDLVIYLDMPTDKAVEMLRSREKATHTRGDIHEVDTEYLAKCRRTAHAAAGLLGWKRVSCVDGGGAVRSIEDIHQEIWDIITGQNLLCP
ncbi:deoxynucleoside kinase [uncultured Pseudoflavonifractor sp.]|uniref:dTMP kinase n=1 Tax=uncultured Pseudoflavonifractor sp. TaxID=1221379 RepID=UPI0025F84EC8|nr:deoxynucleoside kinase [uncultured Pseudoflavonifractor sp.]